MKLNQVLIIITLPIWLLVVVNGLQLIPKKIDIVKEVAETQKYFKLDSCSEADRIYYETIVNILMSYSKMKREERVVYIKENKKVADALGMNRYYGVPISQLESSYNPHLEHEYGEKGINGIKYATAQYAEYIQKRYMPNILLKKMGKIELKSSKDLFDIRTSIRITYTLLWWDLQNYNYSDLWVVSVYHWGGFIAKYYKSGIDIPDQFILNGIEYSVISYYIAWKELYELFNSGQLEATADVVMRYRNKQKKINKKEITFQNMYKIIKKMDKKIKKLEIATANKDNAYKDLKEYQEQAKKEMLKISDDAKKGKAKNMINRIKQVAKNLYEKIKNNQPK